MPNSTSSAAISKEGLPDSGTTHGVRATPIERHASAAFEAARATSASVPPAAARAPATLNANTMPATPRRLSRSAGGALATSSHTRTEAMSMPSSSRNSRAMSKFMRSPP